MKFEINYGSRAAAIPYSALELENVNSIRLLILLCSEPSLCESSDLSYLASKLGLSVGEVIDAAEELAVKKIIREEYETKMLSGSQIEQIVEADPSVKGLMDELCNICGTMQFSNTERSKIIAMIKELGMDQEAIVLLFSHYSDVLAEAGKRVTPSYISKIAFRIHVKTPEDVKNYIEKEKALNGLTPKLKTLFGIGQRTLTKSENEAFTSWNSDLGYGYDMIKEAYDIACDNVSNTNIKNIIAYMNSVLESWSKSGVKTVDDIKALDKQHKENKQYDTKKKDNGLYHSYDTDSIFEEALKRSYEEFEDIKSGKKDN
ncbi:MAG: DnaD domain protein [Firmicutes bacterium]|nr:DnaD domain protein [Candidatus Colimorpha enterica]